jgi:hypothetical protein
VWKSSGTRPGEFNQIHAARIPRIKSHALTVDSLIAAEAVLRVRRVGGAHKLCEVE